MNRSSFKSALPLCAAALLGASAAFAQSPATPMTAPGRITFVGKHTRHTNPGTFKNWKFTKIEIPGGNIEAGTVELEIDLNSISTERGERLNGHLKSADFFDVAKFPTAKVTVTGAKAVEGRPGVYSATATIEIRKVKVQTPLMFQYAADSHQVRGAVDLSRTALTIGGPVEPNNPQSIEDKIPVTFEATLPDSAFH